MADSPMVSAELARFRDNSAGRVSPAWGTAQIRKALVALGDPQDRLPPGATVVIVKGVKIQLRQTAADRQASPQ